MTTIRIQTPQPSALSSAGLSIRDVVMELGDGDTRVRALDGVSLDVAPGEFVAIDRKSVV